MADLAATLAGLDPLADIRLQAQLAAGLGADPTRLNMGSDILGQTLGQLSGQMERARAAGLAQQLAQQSSAALPDVAAAYASKDPYSWAAQNPQASPLARAMVLNSTPSQVIEGKSKMAQTALAELELQQGQYGFNRGRQILESGVVPGMVTPPRQAPPSTGTPAAGGVTWSTPGAAPATTAVSATSPDVLKYLQGGMPPPGDARRAYMARLPIAVQRALLARLAGAASGGAAAAPAAPGR